MSASGWKTERLEDLTSKVGSGATPKGGKAAYKESGIPLIRSMNVHFSGFKEKGLAFIDEAQAAKLNNVVVNAGDVLLNITGASIGRITIAPEEMDGARVNQHVSIVRPTDSIDSRFLSLFFQSPDQQALIDQVQVGATRQALTKSMQLNWKVPVPATLNEQRRIVAEIEKQFTRLDAGVDGLKRVQANLKRYRASVLKAACEGSLVPTEAELCRENLTAKERIERKKESLCDSVPSVVKKDFETGAELLRRILIERRKAHEDQQKNAPRRKKYKEPAAPDTTDLPDLPEGWTWTGFEQLSSGEKNAIKAGPFGSALKKAYYTPSGYKIYGQEQVISGDPYFGDYYISDERYESLKSCSVKPGDILISLVGTTGRVLILPGDCAPGIINPRLLKLSLNHGGVSAKYIQILLEAPQTKAFFKLAAHGGTMDVLNLTILKNLSVPLPPLAEQKRIVEEVERRLSVIEEMEAAAEANLKRAARLRKSILKKAFEGKLI